MILKTFSIQNKSGLSYVAKLDIDHSAYGIEVGKFKESDSVEVIICFNPTAKFILLRNPWILAPQRTSTGVQVVPTKLSDSPNGSDTLAMNVDNIADINLIDENSALLTAMRASESGLELAGAGSDIENSSRLINKFGR
jgi:hypothetical protein